MNKIINYIYSNLDKVCHVVITIILTLIATVIYHNTTNDLPLINASVLGSLTAFLFGICKEVLDFMTGSKFDTHDLLADFIGALLGFILTILLL